MLVVELVCRRGGVVPVNYEEVVWYERDQMMGPLRQTKVLR